MAQKFYVGGEWRDSSEQLEVRFPFDNTLVETIHLAQPSDIDVAIESANDAFEQTSKLQPFERSDIIRYIASEMQKQHEDFAQLLTLENGKTIKESRIEISRTIGVLKIAAGEAERIY